MSNQGVIYCATGTKYKQEAVKSVVSLKKSNPNLNITVFVDNLDDCKEFTQCTLKIIENPNFGFDDKINVILNSPYNKSIFLDTDTFITESIADLFKLLVKFDLAASHAPIRQSPASTHAWKSYEVDVPSAYPEFNTGVIAFRKNKNTNNMLRMWKDHYLKEQKKTGFITDQPAFRFACYWSDIRIATLTNEFNCRFQFPGYSQGTIKIFHGRAKYGRSLLKISKNLNRSNDSRIWLPYALIVTGKYKIPTPIIKLLKIVLNRC